MDKKLKKMISHAYQNSTFYQKKWDGISLDDMLENWSCVPVTYKDEIMYAEEEVIPFFYFAHPDKYCLAKERTSGSTGKCLEAVWDTSDNIRSMLPLWIWRKKYYGIRTSDRFCYFYTRRGIGNKEVDTEIRKNGLGFSKLDLSEKKLEKIFLQMQEFRPKWLLLQPSIAMVLARYIFENGVDKIDSLQYVELSGEMITESGRRFIENAFECPIASQYGCYEANSIAYECPEGKMHVMDENVHVDILDEEGKNVPEGVEGNIIITSKNNFVMPFIKYSIGDYGMLTGEKCNCGNCGKILRLTRGRKNDQIRLKSGNFISVYSFVRIFQCIELIEEIFIYQYQIIQTDYDSFEIHMVLRGNHSRFEKCFLDNIYQEELKNANYRFYYHESLLQDPVTGKLKMFENKMIHE